MTEKDGDNPANEEELLRDEGEDILGGTENVNGSLLTLHQTMNTNVASMSESLKLLQKNGETQAPQMAESARKRKSQPTADDSNSEKSDADVLLTDNKRQKVVNESNGATQDDEADALLDEIAQSLTETEKTAPKVSEKLANIVNLRWLNKLDDKNLKEKSEKYLRPINCDHLITPKVNPEIWERLDRQRRGKDLKLSALQTTLTKVGNITAQTTDMLLKSRAEGIQLDVESIIRMNTDALALLGHISFEISQRRHYVIRPTLNKD